MAAQNFNTLDDIEKQRLETKYGRLKGRLVHAPSGPRYCHGGTCGCMYGPGEGPPGPKCPREWRNDLTTAISILTPISNRPGFCSVKTIWRQGDPKFLTVKDGEIVSVEY